jgi:hypothetical protein
MKLKKLNQKEKKLKKNPKKKIQRKNYWNSKRNPKEIQRKT